MSLRYPMAAACAAIVTFAILWVMQALVWSGEGKLEERRGGRVIDFVRLKRESELAVKKRELPKLARPEQPPPPPDLPMPQADKPVQDAPAFSAADFAPALDASGPSLSNAGGGADTDIVPLVRVSPQYPMQAAERRIEGWVVVEFTISTAGTVKDPVVVRAEPPGFFERAALQAIRGWKYKPQVEHGKPVERAGVKVKLNFKLDRGKA